MVQQVLKSTVFTAGGGTYSLDVSEPATLYLITGSGTLSGSWVVEPANTEVTPFPVDGDNKGISFCILYNASLTIGANNITFFGRALTAQEALVDCLIIATCNAENESSFQVQVIPNFAAYAAWITSNMFAAGSVDTAALASLAVTTAKLALLSVTAAQIANTTITTGKLALLCVTAAQIADGTITGAKIGSATVTGSNIALATVDTSNMVALCITTALLAAKSVTSAKIADGAVGTLQMADGSITLAKLVGNIIDASAITPSLATESIYGEFSFEADAVGTYYIYLPYACTLKQVNYRVIATISGTDAGQVELRDGTGNVMVGGTTAIPLSSTHGTGFTAIPTTNNSFSAGQSIRAVVSKTTPDGKLSVYFTVQRT